MKRVRELDGLRCLAIVAVMVSHYRPSMKPGMDWLALGWTGVDLFFVISGFLITTILVSLRGTSNPYRVFYGRRVVRIFPPYYLVLALLFVLPLIYGTHMPSKDTLEAATFLSSLRLKGVSETFLLLLQRGHLNMQQITVSRYLFTRWSDSLGVFWSLSVEELFYLVWAPIVLRCDRRHLIMIGLTAILLCPFLRVLCHNVHLVEYSFFLCRIDTLMMGSLLALLLIACGCGELRRSTLNGGFRAVGAISLLCLVALCIHDGLTRHMEVRSAVSFSAFGYTLLGIFFASVVGLCALHSEGGRMWARTLRWRVLTYLGTISYMMYLIHIPVRAALFKLDRPNTTLGLMMLGLLSAAVTVGFSAVSWALFEKPILKFKNTSFAMPRRELALEEQPPNDTQVRPVSRSGPQSLIEDTASLAPHGIET